MVSVSLNGRPPVFWLKEIRGAVMAVTVTDEVVALQPVVVLVKVKVTLPDPTPVITPPLVTVATEVLLLVQVPPDVGVSWPVLPAQSDVGAVTEGLALTVISPERLLVAEPHGPVTTQ